MTETTQQTGTAPATSQITVADAGTSGGDLVLTGISKHFGSFRAVDDLDLTIGESEFFAMLGPSGCGKTTTLRMVAGLEEPTGGSISLGGADITYAKPYQRPVNTVFQNYALFPHLDIFENVAFGLRRRKASQVREKVMEALELVELSHLAKRKPTQLSGGQQQRIALARAVVNRPKVLLLDEPLGALDLKLRRQMQVELKRIQTEVGITFVHVTHDQEEAMTMADRVAVMNGGRIEQLGAPADLYESPVTTFVANFLGQSNLIAGQRVSGQSGDGDLIVLDCYGQRIALPAARTVDGDDLLLGVRPEKIQLIASDPVDLTTGALTTAGDNVLTGGVVADVSYTGVSTQYLVAMPWKQELTVFVQNLEVGQRFRRGDPVSLSWKPAHSFGLAGDATAGAQADEDAIPAVGG